MSSQKCSPPEKLQVSSSKRKACNRRVTSERSNRSVAKSSPANPKSAEDYKAGKAAAINFLKGQVMKLSKGKANPTLVGETLVKLLS